MPLSKTLIKNVLSNYTGVFTSALVGILLTPFIIHRIGNTSYGLWALFQSIFGYFGLLDLGFGISVVKYISEFTAKGEQKSINKYGSTIFFTYLGIGALSIVLSLLLAPFVRFAFHIPDEYSRVAFYAVIIGGLTTAVVFLMSFFINILSARQRYDLTNLLGIIRTLIYGVSVVFLLMHGFGLLSLFMLTLVLSVITLIIGYYVAVIKLKFVSIKLSLFNFKTLKFAYKYSVVAFLNSILGQINSSIGYIIISAVLTVKFVAFFAIASKINNVINQVMASIVSVTLPVFSSLWAVNDKEKIRFAYLEITKIVLIISLPVSMFVIIFSESIMNVWIGAGYHLAALSLIILTIVFLIHFTGGYITNILLLGIGQHKALPVVNAFGVVANIIIGFALTKLIELKYGAGYGVLGIPIAFVLLAFAIDMIFWPRYVNRFLELKHSIYILNLVKPVLFIIPITIIALLIKHYYTPASIITLVFESALIGLTYWSLYYLFGLTKDEKDRYTYYIKQFRRQ